MKKKLLTYLTLLIIVIATVELSPYALSPIMYGKSFSRGELKKELKASSPVIKESQEGMENNEEAYLGDHVLHPYMGFVSIPHESYNRFGFNGPDPLTPNGPDKVNICLMGGSVAMGLYAPFKEKLEESFMQQEPFKGKEITVILCALGGFKQPQQMMALNYFLSLGAEFDMVINVDGFNEVVLPFKDNLPFEIHPSYPRHWNVYARKGLNNKTQLLLAKQIALKEEQRRSDQYFSGFWSNSNFGLLLWDVLRNKRKVEEVELDEQLRQRVLESDTDYQVTGPGEPVSDTIQYFRDEAELWASTSKLMHDLSTTGRFKYFHYLQPNQYLENSKELTVEEMRIAFRVGPFLNKTAVRTAYPMLMEEGKKLREQGVHFTDLTQLFKEEKRTVYYDKCCHFNDLGYGMIAEEILEEVVERYTDER